MLARETQASECEPMEGSLISVLAVNSHGSDVYDRFAGGHGSIDY